MRHGTSPNKIKITNMINESPEGRGPKGRNEMPNGLFHGHDRTSEKRWTHRDENHWIKNTARR
jgi:hypothetical protein